MKDKKGEKQVEKRRKEKTIRFFWLKGSIIFVLKRQQYFVLKRQQNFVLKKKRFAQAPLRWF